MIRGKLVKRIIVEMEIEEASDLIDILARHEMQEWHWLKELRDELLNAREDALAGR